MNPYSVSIIERPPDWTLFGIFLGVAVIRHLQQNGASTTNFGTELIKNDIVLNQQQISFQQQEW